MSANPTSQSTVLTIKGLAKPLTNSERLKYSSHLVDMLGSLLRHPGHTVEFRYSSSSEVATWQGGFSAPLHIRHLSILASIKITTHVGQRIRTSNLGDAHEYFTNHLRWGLSRYLLLGENGEDSSIGVIQQEKTTVELDSIGCAGVVQFEDMTMNLGSTIPWSMTLKLQSGWEEGLSQLRQSSRIKRWIKVATGVSLLDPYSQQLWDDQLVCVEGSQVVRHQMELRAQCDNERDVMKYTAMIDAHLSGTPVASIIKSKVVSIAQAAHLLPFHHAGSPWKLEEHSIPFLTTTAQIFPFNPRSNLLGAYCELVLDPDPEATHSTDYHTLVNNALLVYEAPVARMVTIDFERGLQERDHESATSRIKLNFQEGQSINLMDTPMGIHRPTDRILADLAALLEALCENESPSIGWHVVSHRVADEAFALCSLNACPKPYFPGVDSLVDSAMLMLGDYHPATWREASEQLLNMGFVTEAEIAHCQAVPTLRDVLLVLQSNYVIREICGEQVARRVTTNLESLLASMPTFGKSTFLWIRQAEPVTITIDENLQIGGLSKPSSVALQYLMARKLATFGLLEELYPICDEAFIPYHQKQLELNFSTRKVSYLGVEKLLGSSHLIDAMVGDYRSSRSHGVSISLTTRKMDDRLQRLHELSTVTAFFGLGYLGRERFEADIKVNLEPYGVPSGHPCEIDGFLFRAQIKGEPYCISHYLRLPI
ncbi:hypothetical protein [Pseudomonas amygdali]|uniref:Uncharacterized protein n=2 Tax=Pseudomonas amygdali pv. lachrymans TaxID=53707 RepID=A0ABR5KR96_PSEAV|nr:hypothetical protein [Pseudomonas amygdali]KPC17330.1 Uncharacterized protein AC499_0532 [Pseudomonas amygdali pv. lachrymans]RMT06295.1 hypothetical protein ALP54_03792 [Pseudomonas amygdali pv. lachrymans]